MTPYSMFSHQPTLFPWMGWWKKRREADLYIVSGGVRFSKRDTCHRFLLGGKWCSLVIPKEYRNSACVDVRFDPASVGPMASRIRQFATGTPGKSRLDHLADRLEQAETDSLVELSQLMLEEVEGMFEVDTRKTVLSTTVPDPEKTKTERLIARCSEFRALDKSTWYLAGSGARAYLEPDAFPRSWGLAVQQLGDDLPSCSILEILSERKDPFGLLPDLDIVWERLKWPRK